MPGDKFKPLQGLSFADMKKHPSLIPLFVIVGAGGLLAAFYTWRLAVKNPDVSWNPKGNPEPWEEYNNKQYKFITIEGFEPSQRPKY